MLRLIVNEQNCKAVVHYPKEMRKPSKEITVNNWNEVESKWESETQNFIYSTLRGWTIQRNNAYKASKELTGARAAAADKILLILINSETARLHVLCTRIVNHLQQFMSLLPKKESRNFEYAHKVIGPMLMWCKEYKDTIDQKHN